MKSTKDTIKKDINELKQHLENHISSEQMYQLFDKKEDLKKDLEEEKKIYANFKKKYKKKNQIKNLAVVAEISLLLIPMVIVPGIIGSVITTQTRDEYKKKNISIDSSYVEECIYLDNFGNQVVLDEQMYDKDFLFVETAYEKMDNGSYVGKTYTFDKSVDLIEDMEKKVNTNYIELLKELGEPTYANTMVKENIDEKNNKPKVSMIAKVYKKANEDINSDAVIKGEELYAKYNRNSILEGVFAGGGSAAIGTLVSLLLVAFLCPELDKIIKKYKKNANKHVYGKYQSKKKIKELKKEIKKMNGD